MFKQATEVIPIKLQSTAKNLTDLGTDSVASIEDGHQQTLVSVNPR